MQMVKIQISDRKQRAKASYEMMLRWRVIRLRDNMFIIPEAALQLLAELKIAFQELERGDLEYAEKALRDSAAAHV